MYVRKHRLTKYALHTLVKAELSGEAGGMEGTGTVGGRSGGLEGRLPFFSVYSSVLTVLFYS